VVCFGDGQQAFAGFGLHIGGIYYGKQAVFESFSDNKKEEIKGVVGGVLIALIIGNHSAQSIGGYDLRCFEIPLRKSTFS
jgi:hypothetical protein